MTHCDYLFRPGAYCQNQALLSFEGHGVSILTCAEHAAWGAVTGLKRQDEVLGHRDAPVRVFRWVEPVD